MTPQELLAQIRQHRVEVRRVSDLLPYAMNSRIHEPWQVAKIAASIREFGFTNPVLVDAEGTIIAGHARVMAALNLGLEEVPTVCLGHLNAMQLRAYVIADNKLQELSTWDHNVLRTEALNLKDDGFDLGLTGLDDDFIKSLTTPDFKPTDEGDQGKLDEKKQVICPNCGTKI